MKDSEELKQEWLLHQKLFLDMYPKPAILGEPYEWCTNNDDLDNDPDYHPNSSDEISDDTNSDEEEYSLIPPISDMRGLNERLTKQQRQ